MGALFSTLDGSTDITSAVNSVLAGNASLLATNHTFCDVDTPWSCSAGERDNCCYEGNNGLFLQTQFWDYDPATGGNETWTLHGLWSDKCGGGFRQFCNKDWAIDSARDVLLDLGMEDLVEKMSLVWKNMGSRSDNELWTHEFNKHGTCMSTVSPNCYPDSESLLNQLNDAVESAEQSFDEEKRSLIARAKYQNVGDFFQSTVRLYESLPTFEWLKEEGIEPSFDRTYSVAEFSSAIAKHTNGRSVFLGCDRHNNVNQIWYFYKLKGSVADGEFELIDSINTPSCTNGFRYLPKRHNGDGLDAPGYPRPPKNGNGGRNRKTLYVVNKKGHKEGCVISDGSWYRDGKCASFQVLQDVNGVHLTSSKGDCGLSDGVLRCNNRIGWLEFGVDDKGYLNFGGESTWYARKYPKKQEKMPLSTIDGDLKLRIRIE